MKINQFSIAKTNPQQKRAELKTLRLLKGDEEDQLSPATLFETLLTRTHLAVDSPITSKEWLHDLLATPDQALD